MRKIFPKKYLPSAVKGFMMAVLAVFSPYLNSGYVSTGKWHWSLQLIALWIISAGLIYNLDKIFEIRKEIK